MAPPCPPQSKALPGSQGARMSPRQRVYKWLWQNKRAMALNQQSAEPKASLRAEHSHGTRGLILLQIKMSQKEKIESYRLQLNDDIPLCHSPSPKWHTHWLRSSLGAGGTPHSRLSLRAVFSHAFLRSPASAARPRRQQR